VITAILEKLEGAQPFTDQEAWNIFKIAAISEAVGWTILIFGILFKHFVTPFNNIPVLIAGKIHGTIFLIYLVAVIITYSSLHWSRKRTIVAALASVPPYGSLAFEQWAAYKRRGEALKTYREISVRAIIIKGNGILAVQPKDSGFWNLPGGVAKSKETAEEALKRMVLEQTGVVPAVGRLVYILQYHSKSTERLEMFFNVSNAADYKEKDLKDKIKVSKALDGIRYVEPKGNQDLRPEFLQAEPVIDTAKQQKGQVILL